MPPADYQWVVADIRGYGMAKKESFSAKAVLTLIVYNFFKCPTALRACPEKPKFYMFTKLFSLGI